MMYQNLKILRSITQRGVEVMIKFLIHVMNHINLINSIDKKVANS